MTEEESRELVRSNFYAQLSGLGFDPYTGCYTGRSSSQNDSATRLLTYEEAMSAVGHGWEEVWFEADPAEGEAEYKECFEVVFIYGHYVAADGDIGEVDIERYNRPYHSRLWLGEERPTDAQRDAAPWEG